MNQERIEEVLERAKTYIADEKNWIREQWANTENGTMCSPADSDASKFCVDGALLRASYDLAKGKNEYIRNPRLNSEGTLTIDVSKEVTYIYVEARDYLVKEKGEWPMTINDNDLTTHDDVLSYLEYQS